MGGRSIGPTLRWLAVTGEFLCASFGHVMEGLAEEAGARGSFQAVRETMRARPRECSRRAAVTCVLALC